MDFIHINMRNKHHIFLITHPIIDKLEKMQQLKSYSIESGSSKLIGKLNQKTGIDMDQKKNLISIQSFQHTLWQPVFSCFAAAYHELVRTNIVLTFTTPSNTSNVYIFPG